MCNDVAADGLDSAGCSPKDDEDDSDDETLENRGAAALKPNKISPASGYHAGSSYYYPMGKEKSWLARCDDRQLAVPMENNSPEPSEDSYYSRYQRRRSDDSTPAGRGFSADSDAVMQRMMRRKQARRERELAGLTTADSVDGYRGKDCSIDELIEYIDAKPQTVPKTGQRQTGNRKKRKKKRSSNRPAKSKNDDFKSTTPVDRTEKHNEVDSEKATCEKLPGETVAAADDGMGTINERETCLLSGNAKVDSESVSELPLHCDTFFQMLPSEGSSSNMSDGDNVPDCRTGGNFGNYAQCPEPEAYREVAEMPSLEAGLDGGCVDDNLTVKPDSEPVALIHAPVTQITETASSADIDEFGTVLQDSCCSKPSDSTCTVSDKKTELDNEDYKSKISNADKNVQMNEVIAASTENTSPDVSLSCTGVAEDVVVDSVNGMNVYQHRHSLEESCTTVHREILCQTVESIGSAPKIHSTETGQSTPSSSMSDARESVDIDCQSLTDDMSSDLDFSIQTFHESDFTVVAQKKKKKVTRQNVGSVDCLRRTFYNRNHRDTLAVRDWQASCGNESVKESSTVPSAVPITCSSFNTELCSVPVTRQTSTPLEVPGEFVRSSVHGRQTGLHTDNVSSLAYVDHNASNAVSDQTTSASASGENKSQSFANSATASSHETAWTVKDVKRSSAEHETQDKVFLDTRQPDVGVAPAIASCQLSFWYDVTIPENQPTAVQTDIQTLSSSYSIAEPSANDEVSLTNASASFADVRTTVVVTSSLSVATRTSDVNTVLYVNSCTEQPVSLRSAAGDNPLLLGNASQLPHCDRQTVDNSSHTYEQPISSQADAHAHVSLTSGSSGSHYTVNNSTRSGNLIVRPVHSSFAVVSASAADSIRHLSSHSRQLFDVRDTQLFLYSG